MSKLTFAEKQLKKYGWKEGQALGLNAHGNKPIKEAITATLKQDTKGLGYDKKPTEWAFEWWDHVFNKASANIATGDSKQSASKESYCMKISDEDLLAACEGRTCRKGARGLTESRRVSKKKKKNKHS